MLKSKYNYSAKIKAIQSIKESRKEITFKNCGNYSKREIPIISLVKIT